MLKSDNSDEDNSSQLEADFQSKLDKLREAVWSKRPILKNIMKKHGGKTLYMYAQDFLDVNKSPVLDERKNELIETAGELIAKRLGEKTGQEVADQLRKYALVSTADHHGPITHPFWVNSNIISAIPYLNVVKQSIGDLKHLIVFSFASISANNASAFPRGILFHGGVGDENYIRQPILPDKLKMGVVYTMRAFNQQDLQKARRQLDSKKSLGKINPQRCEKIQQILTEHFGKPDVLSAPDLASQITKINYSLWPEFFSKEDGAEKIPKLIYLEIETLVRELLLRYHLFNPSSLIYKFLFDPEYNRLTVKYFNNLAGAFSMRKKTGTYLFWGLDKKLHRVRLRLDDVFLHSFKRKFNVRYTAEEVANALREKKIFPSMLLCYLIVSLYYGMKCLGGFCQVHDLTMIKLAWMNLLIEMDEEAQAAAVLPVQTKELGGDGLVLSYRRTMKGEVVPATGLDLILDNMTLPYENYVELSKKVTLNEIMSPMLPEMYTVLYPLDKRDRGLLLSPAKIFKVMKLQEKLS